MWAHVYGADKREVVRLRYKTNTGREIEIGIVKQDVGKVVDFEQEPGTLTYIVKNVHGEMEDGKTVKVKNGAEADRLLIFF